MRAAKGERLLELESRKSFNYFLKEINTDKKSPGFGLIRDRAPGNPTVASIAAVGFGLTALVIGVERGWISIKKAHDRASGTLDMLLNNAEQVNGFFYHFLDINTAKRCWNCEVSVIDTAIAVCGALVVGEYFGDEIRYKAQKVYERVNWNWYRNPATNQFYMGYSPEKGFSGAWSMCAEQLMMYFLGAASPTHPINVEMFYNFDRPHGTYGSIEPIVHSLAGSLFVYQFSHAWFDFRCKRDRQGIDWWENSVRASKANRQYCMDCSGLYKTFGPDSWGLTACDGPLGYNGDFGALPRKGKYIHGSNDGTVPPCGAAGSIVFTPEESISALEYYYAKFPQLWGKYGFKDAYNQDVNPVWFSSDVIGIDKGITLIMIENFRSGLVWEVFMKNEYVRRGMELIGFTDAENTAGEMAGKVSA